MTEYELKQNALTQREFRLWRQTEDGLRAWCQHVKYEPKLCKGELQRLYDAAEKQNLEAWDIALSIAKTVVYDAFRDEPEILSNREKRISLEQANAERQLVELGYRPPTYTTMGNCDSCGPVFLPNHSPFSVANCPWCSTEYGQIWREIRGNDEDKKEN